MCKTNGAGGNRPSDLAVRLKSAAFRPEVKVRGAPLEVDPATARLAERDTALGHKSPRSRREACPSGHRGAVHGN